MTGDTGDGIQTRPGPKLPADEQPPSRTAVREGAARPASRDPVSSGPRGGLEHIRALDGLRGIAVAAVVLFHFAPSVLPGGFLGVDVFFVLSGFLICSLLMVECRGTGGVRLGRFWIRRVRRLLPALLLVLLALAAYAAWGATTLELARLRSHGLATLGYFANWRYISEGASYTDLVSGASPLIHTWSLAIEEQFYLVFPLVVAGLAWWARGRTSWLRRGLVIVAATGIVASVAAMALQFSSSTDPSREFYGTDTRIHTLLVGVVLGAALMGSPPRRGRPASVLAVLGVAAGIALVIAMATAHDTDAWLYRGGFLLVALCVGAVITASRRSRALRTVLEARPLVGLGVISYGVYLWHWPIFVLVDEERTGTSGLALFVIRVALTLGIALASFRLVEAPIRAGMLRARLGRAGALIAAPVAAVVVGGLLVWATAGPSLGSSGPVALPAPEVATPTGPVRAIMFGDSVANSLAGAFERNPWTPSQSPFDPKRVEIWDGAKWGCSFLDGRVALPRPDGDGYALGDPTDGNPLCGDWHGDLERISQNLAPNFLIVSLNNDLYDRELGGEIVAFGSPKIDALLVAFFDGLRVDAARRGTRLVLLTSPIATGGSFTAPDDGGWREAHLESVMRTYARDHVGVAVLDLGGELCPRGNCSKPKHGFTEDMRYDGLHYTNAGARAVANWMTPQLEALRADGSPTPTVTTATSRPSNS